MDSGVKGIRSMFSIAWWDVCNHIKGTHWCHNITPCKHDVICSPCSQALCTSFHLLTDYSIIQHWKMALRRRWIWWSSSDWPGLLHLWPNVKMYAVLPVNQRHLCVPMNIYSKCRGREREPIANMHQMSSLWESAEAASCRQRNPSGVFFTLNATFLYFFFQLA